MRRFPLKTRRVDRLGIDPPGADDSPGGAAQRVALHETIGLETEGTPVGQNPVVH